MSFEILRWKLPISSQLADPVVDYSWNPWVVSFWRSYQCLVCYLTHVLQNMEGETWTQDVHVLCFMTIFCRSYPRERKSHPWILFLIKVRLEMKVLWGDLSSPSTITKKIGDTVTTVCFICWGWPKSNFSPFLTGEMTILVDITYHLRCRPQ